MNHIPLKILVLQHIEAEDPGHIKDLMEADGCESVTVELNKGDNIPDDLTQFDAMLCMGGPMDTWMENENPWLIEEKKCIKTFVVELEKPFLGFCLGAQLLGEVLGGKVVKSKAPEIGVLDVYLRKERCGDALFGAFPENIKAVQWHSCEVRDLEHNPQVQVLASSPTTEYQIFRYKRRAYGIQFHIEIREETVKTWSEVPEYRHALLAALGGNALPEFERETRKYMGGMNKLCGELYENWKRLCRTR